MPLTQFDHEVIALAEAHNLSSSQVYAQINEVMDRDGMWPTTDPAKLVIAFNVVADRLDAELEERAAKAEMAAIRAEEDRVYLDFDHSMNG